MFVRRVAAAVPMALRSQGFLMFAAQARCINIGKGSFYRTLEQRTDAQPLWKWVSDPPPTAGQMEAEVERLEIAMEERRISLQKRDQPRPNKKTWKQRKEESIRRRIAWASGISVPGRSLTEQEAPTIPTVFSIKAPPPVDLPAEGPRAAPRAVKRKKATTDAAAT